MDLGTFFSKHDVGWGVSPHHFLENTTGSGLMTWKC